MPYSEADPGGRPPTADPLFLLGGMSLAFVAGSVNTISLGYFHVPVSHMTGAVTRLSIDIGSSISFFLFASKANFALFLVAFSCGLQNAMASNYMGLIIRTTHLTGIVTDLGVLIGQALKHRKPKAWKMAFLLSILLGFFAGGLSGFLAFGRIGYFAIFIPASMCLAGAIGFYFLRIRRPDA
jgi:uncharacterized membrane protein YoaK (UPF0700 family)